MTAEINFPSGICGHSFTQLDRDIVEHNDSCSLDHDKHLLWDIFLAWKIKNAACTFGVEPYGLGPGSVPNLWIIWRRQGYLCLQLTFREQLAPLLGCQTGRWGPWVAWDQHGHRGGGWRGQIGHCYRTVRVEDCTCEICFVPAAAMDAKPWSSLSFFSIS